MDRISLYEIHQGSNSFFLDAILTPEGQLMLSGQDFREENIDIFGDEEYEYYYELTKEDTAALTLAFQKEYENEDELLKNLDRFFGKEMKNTAFRIFCYKHSIKFSTHVI